MTEADVLNVIMARGGASSGVNSISRELKSVLVDISSREDFLTQQTDISTVAGTASYDEPGGLKRVYECSLNDGSILIEKTYRDYLAAVADGSGIISGKPVYYARRHSKMFLWPKPDAVYTITADYAYYHPETFTDILFGSEFSEAIFEGVLAALYKGQLFEKLRLTKRQISDDALDEDVSDGTNTTVTDQDLAGNALVYEFSGDFPEYRLHNRAYEAEIRKLIANMNLDVETVLVEYRDI